MQFASFRRLTIALAVIGLVLLAIASNGCRRDNRSVGNVGRSSGVSSSDRNQVLLDSAAGGLAELPEQSILELRPPSVVLDATKSSDGQDVEAELTTLSTDGRPIYNVLRVPRRNGRFKAVGVRSGDLVKWYAHLQSELESEFGGGNKQLTAEQVREILKLPEEQRQEVTDSMIRELELEGDIVSTTAFEFKVAQVVDANTLMVDLSTLTEEEQGRLRIDLPMRMEVLRYRDSRFSDLVIDLNRYARRGVPVLGWEPSPDKAATEQIVERLNQWLRQTAATARWSEAKLIESLPESLRGEESLQSFINSDSLNRAAFSLPSRELRATQSQGYEGRLLQEATWVRDIGNWVTKDELEMRGRVDRLFDWVVRNLALEEPGENLPDYRPWQAMVHGHATADGRAWVFAQLCRQQDVPVVVIRPAGDAGPVWTGAVLDGQIYLYDCRLGLAIENADGRTATLAEVSAEVSLLESLDLPNDPYFPSDASIESVVAEIVAGPFALTRRAALLEERLPAANSLMLFVDADRLAADVEKLSDVGSTRLWEYPYQTLLNQLNSSRIQRTLAAREFEPFVHKPRLWKARLLTFRGALGETVDTSRGNLASTVDDHRDAGRLYTNENVRPTDQTISKLETDDGQRAWSAAKRNATYWQGLLSFERGDYTVAINWLEMAEKIEPTGGEGTWSEAAKYNRARALEALGKNDEAAGLLESSSGAQARGNRLRAKRLAK